MQKLWSLKISGYDPERVVADGNRFLIANGYMGIRGTVEESVGTACPAVNLAGVYDQYQNRWREPVNAPNGLFVKVFVNGKAMSLGETDPVSHSLEISYRHGIFRRETDFGAVKLHSERIASLAQPHLLASSLHIAASEDCEIKICTGISTDIWDINGPHLFDYRFQTGETLLCEATTGEKHIPVAVSQCVTCDFDAEESYESEANGVFRVLQFAAKKERLYTLSVFSGVYTGLDTDAPAVMAIELAQDAKEKGFAQCLLENCTAWEQVWENCAVEMEGNNDAALAMHASQYYLNSIAPRHTGNLSIPARGLSGQTYKGAIFWDSEIFLFPMFVYTQPEVAKSLLRYRIGTLPGALKKAAEYGYRGAFYAWESQEGGAEGCTNFNVVDVFTHRPVRTYFRDKQIHISADIAYTMRQYYEITGDTTLLEEGGAEVILQCARFYLSRATAYLDRDTVDFADVIGPDEYHERVTNNAFTNQMALYCMESALLLETICPVHLKKLIEKLDYADDWKLLERVSKRIRKPQEISGVIEQFDGYFDLEDCSLDTVRSRLCDPREYWGGDHGVAGTTQIIKQADVIALMALMPEKFSDESICTNWAYYEPRTEHGSSLSACMYALTACRVGQLDRAWELFMKSASIDIVGSSKQWAGEIYIGGTHPASNGGAWMIAVQGFAGLRIQDGKLELHPNLPEQITRLRFPVTIGNTRYQITVTHEGHTVESDRK